MLWSGVNGDQRFSTPIDEHLTVFFDQIFAMAMMGREIEISGLNQVIPNAAHHLGVITVSEFGNQDADSERAAIAERTRQQAWLIVKFFSGGFDAIASGLGNVTAGNIIENDRNRRRIQT